MLTTALRTSSCRAHAASRLTASAALPRTPLAHAAARRPGGLACPPRHVRALATRRDEEDKSWGEIASDAATVASGALKKLGKTALGALGGLLDSGKGSSSTPETRRAPPQRPTSRPGDEGDGDIFSWPGSAGRGGPLAGGRSGAGGPLAGLVGGLVGRALGGVLSGVAGALASQAADAAALRDRALAALQSDSAVLAAFGGRPVPAPGPTSQAGSTVVVNGVAQKRLTLRFSVGGPAGTGTVEVNSAGEGTPPDVRVRCPDGRVVSVSGSSGRGGGGWRGGGDGGGRVGGGSGGGGGAGDVIDVDFREL